MVHIYIFIIVKGYHTGNASHSGPRALISIKDHEFEKRKETQKVCKSKKNNKYKRLHLFVNLVNNNMHAKLLLSNYNN